MNCLYCNCDMQFLGDALYRCASPKCPIWRYNQVEKKWELAANTIGMSVYSLFSKNNFSTDELSRLLKLKVFW